jgi:hypothetical protein
MEFLATLNLSSIKKLDILMPLSYVSFVIKISLNGNDWRNPSVLLNTMKAALRILRAGSYTKLKATTTTNYINKLLGHMYLKS